MQLIHFSEAGQSRIGIKTERGFLNAAKAAAALSLPVPSYIDDVLKDPVQAAQLEEPFEFPLIHTKVYVAGGRGLTARIGAEQVNAANAILFGNGRDDIA